MKGTFRKLDDKTLEASGPEAMEALAAVHRGANCIGDIRGARNVEQFNLFWALCGLVAEARDVPKEVVKDWLLEKQSLVDVVFYPDGAMRIRPRSIKWESMEQAKFSAFMDLAIPAIAELLGAAPADVIKRFDDLLDPDARRHFKKVRRGGQ
jgi:hypothetical protein